MRTKFILNLLVIVAVAFSGYGAYSHFQANLAAEREEAARVAYLQVAGKHVKIATIYTGRAIHRLSGGEPMTNEDFSAAVKADIADLENRLIDMTTNSPPERREITATAVGYVESCKLLLRNLENYHRNDLEWTATQEKIDYLSDAAPFYSASARRQAREFLDSVPTTLDDLIEAMDELNLAAQDLQSQSEAATRLLPAETLIKPVDLEPMKASLQKRIEGSQTLKAGITKDARRRS